MGKSIAKLQGELLRNYYRYFSKYNKRKDVDVTVAWVSSFAPIELLEACGIYYCYPESYAAVIAASGKEQEMLSASAEADLSTDCCSYACCIEGCLDLDIGPRGTLPKPDILITTNNQCNTLCSWWNMLSIRLKVPLIVLDYPGEGRDRDNASKYVLEQHQRLINSLEELSGNKLSIDLLDTAIHNSEKSIDVWKSILKLFPTKNISPTKLFDDISFLITSRCKSETSQLYKLMCEELEGSENCQYYLPKIFWIGYPLWYHQRRYLANMLDDCKVVGSNYLTWWNLDYSGDGPFDKLFNAYNYTFLNLNQNTRTKILSSLISGSGAEGAIAIRNKSCKCDFVSFRNIDIPFVELEADMIDRTYLDDTRAIHQIRLLKDIIS